MLATSRSRLVSSAFELFTDNGYQGTTVDDIATRAGLSRTTFFRYFSSKEAVVFPDHDALLPRVEERLRVATTDTLEVAVREAVLIVLDHYMAEGAIARKRYGLTSTVPALRDRESASVQHYTRVFARHLRAMMQPSVDDLDVEIMAAATVAAHNYVLRQWLQGATQDPRALLQQAIARVAGTGRIPGAGLSISIQVAHPDATLNDVVATMRRSLSPRHESV